MESVVLHERRDGGIHLVTINRPRAYNALNSDVLVGLNAALDAIVADPDARVAILTGSGDKAFVAGADIGEMRGYSPLEAEHFAARGQALGDRIAALGIPVIAAVDGFALGGGCELAMACDLLIAGSRAKFGQPEVNLGLIPGFGGTQRLVRRVGLANALDLCLTARQIGADEAVAMGLASRKVDGNVLEAALVIAKEIASKGPIAIRMCKRAIHDYADGALAAGLAGERMLFAACFTTADQREGAAAFLEKRAPKFEGR